MQGSVVIDFSVWTDSNAVAATFPTAIAAADLTIPSGGGAPTVYPQVDLTRSAQQEEKEDIMAILSTRVSASHFLRYFLA